MPTILPFWFKQRQCKLEQFENEHTAKVTGPNLGEAYLFVRVSDNNVWHASLRKSPAGEDVAVAQADRPTEGAAWDVAFELYRTHVIS